MQVFQFTVHNDNEIDQEQQKCRNSICPIGFNKQGALEFSPLHVRPF